METPEIKKLSPESQSNLDPREGLVELSGKSTSWENSLTNLLVLWNFCLVCALCKELLALRN